jgi:acyl carrier protein
VIRDDLQQIFREVFEAPALVISDELDAGSVDRWDSLTHVNMIVAVERHFGVKFKNAEVAKLKCVGDLVGLIKKKKPELQ